MSESTNATRSAWREGRGREIAEAYSSVPGGLLPALQALQEEFGYIPKPAIALLAHAFNLSRAEVYGTATFYHDFRMEGPAGRRVLRLCRSEACQAVGGDDTAQCAKTLLGLEWRETSSSGEWTLEPVFCLGLCASGPAAMLDGEPVARLTPEKLRSLIGGAK